MTTTAPRRELLLQAAADLFAARGFHAVGIDDIGVAAGITGPGVYRHFPSKQSLLETLTERMLDRMLTAAQGVDDLDHLVDLHVGMVVTQQAMVAVWVREQRALGDAVRRDFRARMREYELHWRAVLGRQRPDLDEPSLALIVASALGMLNASALIESPLPVAARTAVLHRQALAALQA